MDFKSKDKDHGRLETREYFISEDISWLLKRNEGWESLNGIGACISTVEVDGKITKSISYSIYSEKGINAKIFGTNKRSHWEIENSLHWVLDMAFREDESRKRANNVAENVNILRHIALNLLKQDKSCKLGIASKRRRCSYDCEYLVKILNSL